MRRNTLSILMLAALIAAMSACGGGKKKSGGGADGTQGGTGLVVSLSDSLIDNRRADTISFGRVHEGERVVQQFTVRNAGDKAVVITSLDLSCGCIEAEYPKQPLKPGDEQPMTLTLDTRNLGGWVFKTAIMQTTLSSKPYILYVTAEIE